MCNRRARALSADEAGNVAVEFAIVGPVFFAMLFGVFWLGWALHCNETVDYAVNIASRQLVGNPSLTQSQIQAEVQSLLTNLADPSGVTVTLTEDAAGSSPRTAVVAATYVHTIHVPLLSSFDYTYKTQSTAILSP